jgi:hypothetical protein
MHPFFMFLSSIKIGGLACSISQYTWLVNVGEKCKEKSSIVNCWWIWRFIQQCCWRGSSVVLCVDRLGMCMFSLHHMSWSLPTDNLSHTYYTKPTQNLNLF